MRKDDKPCTNQYDDVRQPFITLVVITVVLIGTVYLLEQREAPLPSVELKHIRPDSIDALEKIFAGHDYDWPPSGAVPPLGVKRLPPDLGELAVDRKKALFFRTVLPLILAENRRILSQREFIRQTIDDYESLGKRDRRRLGRIAKEYEVEGEPGGDAFQKQLLRRVDIIPVPLALAQAANESAWGSSRFAVNGNSLFGVWTWDESSGMTPRRRESGKQHLVRSYPDLQTSVRAYMHTLNTVHAYRVFRQKRREMRLNGRPLDAVALAGLLDRYSERGMAYIAELRRIMLGNGLTRLGRLRLAG